MSAAQCSKCNGHHLWTHVDTPRTHRELALFHYQNAEWWVDEAANQYHNGELPDEAAAAALTAATIARAEIELGDRASGDSPVAAMRGTANSARWSGAAA